MLCKEVTFDDTENRNMRGMHFGGSTVTKVRPLERQ
jgi:hypothetical protein